MATAATVRTGMADIAFGIEAAARAHGLAFVPIVTEHYYLACRRNAPARIAVDTIVATAKSTTFARAVAHIGGYDTKSTGSRVQLRASSSHCSDRGSTQVRAPCRRAAKPSA